MTLGTVTPSITLHNPGHVHCGSQDPVEGHVSIKWAGKTQSAELFGPAQIYVTLQGRIKIRVGETTQGRSVRTRIPLFATRHCVHDGPLRIQHQETQNFPFQVRFPSDWRWQPDERWKQWSAHKGFDVSDKTYSLDPDQPLPPSMITLDNNIRDDGEALIQYRVEVETVMPNLDVTVSSMHKLQLRKDVLYERPRMARAIPAVLMPNEGTLVVRDRCLIPESMRSDPHGFRQRASAVFRPVPKPESHLDWAITLPRNVHRGQAYVVTVRCHPSAEKSNAPETPEVRLLSMKARAEARVVVRTEQDSWLSGGWSQYAEAGKETVTLDAKSEAKEADNGGPSTAPVVEQGEAKSAGVLLHKGNDWTQTVPFEILTKDICTSIKSMCIRRVYTILVKCQISVAGRREELSRSVQVEVYPPLAEEEDPLPPPAPEYGEVVSEKEDLPAYEA